MSPWHVEVPTSAHGTAVPHRERLFCEVETTTLPHTSKKDIGKIKGGDLAPVGVILGQSFDDRNEIIPQPGPAVKNFALSMVYTSRWEIAEGVDRM